MKVVDVEIPAAAPARDGLLQLRRARGLPRSRARPRPRVPRARRDAAGRGPRHHEACIDGIGPCGRQLCCSSHLRKFEPISVKMAKAQDMPLTDNRLLGNCGRLKCCLLYEFSTYQELRSRLPRVNTPCQASCGGRRVHDGQGPVASRAQAERSWSASPTAPRPRCRSISSRGKAGPTSLRTDRPEWRVFYLTTPIYYVNAPPAPGARVHDDPRRHDGALAPAPGRRRVPPHGDRRARRQDRPGGGQGRRSRRRRTPTRVSGRSGEAWAGSASATTTSSGRRSPATRRRCRRSSRSSGTPARSTSGGTAGTTASAASASTPRRRSSTASARTIRRPLTWIEEENYFFRMSKYQGWLIDYIERAPGPDPPRALPQRDPRASCAIRCRTSRSAGRARGSSGASRCRSTTAT